MQPKSSLLFICALLLPLASLAATPPSVKADTKDQFDQVAAHVRLQMQPGGRFEFLNSAERTTVERDLGAMQSLYATSGSVNARDDKSKIQLYNEQSEVNAILTRRDGEKEICTHEIPTGSLTSRTTCRTYSDMQREHEEDMKTKADMLQPQVTQSQCLPGAGGRTQCTH